MIFKNWWTEKDDFDLDKGFHEKTMAQIHEILSFFSTHHQFFMISSTR
jgi:hypothetical protein